MSKPTVLNAEEALETGKSIVKKTGKVVGKTASDTAKAVTSQIMGNVSGGQDSSTQDFIKDLYGAGKKQASDSSLKPQAPAQNQKPSDLSLSKTPEEQQELMSLRKKLHDEVYYDKLVNPKKGQPEERPAEKVEKEKQQEMIDLQQKEKEKPPPIAVQRAMTKTEKFPGGGG